MFNFFLKNKQSEINENNLFEKANSPKERIDNFLKFAKDVTEKRQRDFKTLMRFALESEQWTNAELNQKDDENDVALTFNFSLEYIERYIARLFPRNAHTGVMEVGVKISHDDNAKSQKYEDEILDIYYKNQLANILIEQAINFLCGGSGCFFYPQNEITKRADIISINPSKCYLGWKTGKLVQFAYKNYIGEGEYEITYYDLKNIYIQNTKSGNVEKSDNPYNFIPFSWIPNFPKPHDHEGNSKIKLLGDLDRIYNQTASSYNKRIEENTEPHVLVKSDMANTSKIERGKKKITRLGVNDDMKYLELKEGKEILEWLELIEKRIINKTGIVHSAGALKTHISGKSLSFQYSDMMDLIGFMRLNWDKAFRELNHAILTYKYGEDVYNSDPVYQPFITQDNSERVEQYTQMITNDLISHRDAIDELRGVENADEKVKEILAEKALFNPKPEKNEKEEKEKNNFNN